MTEKVPVTSIGKRAEEDELTVSFRFGRLLAGADQEKGPAKKSKIKITRFTLFPPMQTHATMLEMSNSKNQALRSLFLGGLLPVIVFTVVEEKYGPLWGLIFGMIFGVLEILYEAIKYRKVELVTWVGNGLLLGMGGISLLTQDGLWFKLQPSLMEAGMAFLLLGTGLFGSPFLLMMAEKQKTFETMHPLLVPQMKEGFRGINWRLGVFFLVHSVLAAYAALYWSSRSWALLKGVGLTLSLIVYLACEVWFLRKRMYAR